ncbi:hypothetical protein N9287_02030 [Candidatus Pelagibacter sp.]|jgi:hypothetical protein|nr:hypothetical protein [Candidatus Pelagibacter sp.]
MKFFFLIVTLGLLFSGNAYSKVTPLTCKLEKSNNEFTILLDHLNNNAVWNDIVAVAQFSAKFVTFIVAEMGSVDNIYLKMHYSINRTNLEVVKTVTLTTTDKIDKIDEVISLERGLCKIGSKIETKF